MTGGRSLTWTEFCGWLAGKRVASEDVGDDAETVLRFEDGTMAIMSSAMTEGSPYYSEATPGCSGSLTTPTVTVYELEDLA